MADDEENVSKDWLGEITEMLLNGGYFRVRVTSLSPFDKVMLIFHVCCMLRRNMSSMSNSGLFGLHKGTPFLRVKLRPLTLFCLCRLSGDWHGRSPPAIWKSSSIFSSMRMRISGVHSALLPLFFCWHLARVGSPNHHVPHISLDADVCRQKIKLCENIEKALVKMKCPSPIQVLVLWLSTKRKT